MEEENLNENINLEEKEEETEEAEEETEIEETEISLTEGEIDDWIVKLDGLKETKQSIILEIDDETELKINFEEDDDENEREDDLE